MTKPHKSLRPSTNILLIFIWGILTALLIFISNPIPYILLTVGVTIGVTGGILQTFSFNNAKESYVNSKSFLEIRKVMKKTKWGKLYLYLLRGGNLLMVIIALNSIGNPISNILVGYFSLMFAREIITLKPTFELSKLSS